MMKSVGSGAALALAASALVTGAANAQDLKLRMQSGYSPDLSVIGQSATHFADTVQALSGGQMKVEYFDPGALVPSPEIFDAVSAGRIDLGYTWSGFQAGKIPAINVFIGVPFGPDHETMGAWLTEGGGQDLLNELYAPYGVVSRVCGVSEAEPSGWFKEEITRPEQLKGMKIRYVGLAAEVMTKLGASPTLIPGNETFAALERGVIDAAEFSLPSIDKDTGFYKIAKNYYFPGWHTPGSMQELLINKELWDGMSDQQRAIIDTACGDTTRYLGYIALGQQGDAMEFFKEQGVQFRTWNDTMIETFRTATEEVMAEHLAADPDFKRAWDSLNDYAENVYKWSSVASINPNRP